MKNLNGTKDLGVARVRVLEDDDRTLPVARTACVVSAQYALVQGERSVVGIEIRSFATDDDDKVLSQLPTIDENPEPLTVRYLNGLAFGELVYELDKQWRWNAAFVAGISEFAESRPDLVHDMRSDEKVARHRAVAEAFERSPRRRRRSKYDLAFYETVAEIFKGAELGQNRYKVVADAMANKLGRSVSPETARTWLRHARRELGLLPEPLPGRPRAARHAIEGHTSEEEPEGEERQ